MSMNTPLLGILAAICCIIHFVNSQTPNANPEECSELFISRGCKNCTIDASKGMKCTSCGPWQFYNETAQTCQNCIAGCFNCSDAASCVDCGFGYFRTDANITMKSQGYRHTCNACMVKNCLNCTDETTCNFCSVGYTLDLEKPGTCKYRVEEWVGTAKNIARNTLIVIVVLCLLVVLGAVGWFYWEKKQERDYIDAQAQALRSREQSRLPPNREQEGTLTDRANRRTPKEDDDSQESQEMKERVKMPNDRLNSKPKIISLEVEKQSGQPGSTLNTLEPKAEDEEL